MRGELEGTKLVCPGEGEFWDNLTAVLCQLRQGYKEGFVSAKEKVAMVTSCRRGNPRGLKGEKKSQQDYLHTGMVFLERMQNPSNLESDSRACVKQSRKAPAHLLCMG